MRRFNRFALAAVTIAFTLNGCGAEQPTAHVAQATPVALPYEKTICGETYLTDEQYEINVDGVCASVNKYYDPTTPLNLEMYRYAVFSGERQARLNAAYASFATMLRDKMLSGEVPSRVHGDFYYLPKGRLLKDAYGNVGYEPAPINGWADMESIDLKDDGFTYDTPRIQLRVLMRDGKVDTSVEPARAIYYGNDGEIEMKSPFPYPEDDKAPVPNTSDALSYYGFGYTINLINYVKKATPFDRQLRPTDKDITVVLSPRRDPKTGWAKSGPDTIEDLKLNDAEFIAALSKVQVNGSDWQK